MKRNLPVKTKIMFYELKNFRFLIALFFCLTISFSLKAQVSETLVPASQVQLVKIFKLNAPAFGSPLVVDPNAVYSNVNNFTGYAYANGSAALQNGNNTITALVADSLGLSGMPPFSIGSFRFSVASFNTLPVSARPLIRFYAADGVNGSPGTLLKALAFNPISFDAGSTNIFTANITPFIITTGSVWAGITFDNDSATTGATLAQLNLLGQGMFDPVDKGNSDDFFFETDSAGSFNANNPAGAFYNFGGNPVANFGWELISSTTLPVTFTNFKLQKNGFSNIVSWTTSQEFNSGYFAIEQSTDGINFRQIGKVAAAGSSSISINYQYADKAPAQGINYYRVRMVDIDNSVKYSEIKSIKSAGLVNFTVFPNPVRSKLMLSLDAVTYGNAEINITDADGRNVYESRVSVINGGNNLSIDVNNLSKGTYFIKINMDNENYSSKFNKL